MAGELRSSAMQGTVAVSRRRRLAGGWEHGSLRRCLSPKCKARQLPPGPISGIKEGKIKYSATVFGDLGVSTAGIYGHGVPTQGVVPTKDKYMGYEGIAHEMAKFFKGGPPPVAASETLEIFAVMEAAERSRAGQGVVVSVADVLKSIAIPPE